MATTFFPDDAETTLALLAIGVAAVAVVTDLRRRRIPNALTVPAVVVGLAANAFVAGLAGLGWATAGLLIGGSLFLVPVTLGGMGAGDLKLLAALGALGGPGFAVWCAIYASIIGGVMAVAVLLMKRQLVPVVGGAVFAVVAQRLPRATSNIRLPYAVPIALGAVVALTLA